MLAGAGQAAAAFSTSLPRSLGGFGGGGGAGSLPTGGLYRSGGCRVGLVGAGWVLRFFASRKAGLESVGGCATRSCQDQSARCCPLFQRAAQF